MARWWKVQYQVSPYWSLASLVPMPQVGSQDREPDSRWGFASLGQSRVQLVTTLKWPKSLQRGRGD